jgi:GTPase involved in cell partitioning and DNA repair
VEGPLGHWENGDHGGKVYTTALCALMLEVYYRYLPTFKHVEGKKEEGASGSQADDVVVDVI